MLDTSAIDTKSSAALAYFQNKEKQLTTQLDDFLRATQQQTTILEDRLQERSTELERVKNDAQASHKRLRELQEEGRRVEANLAEYRQQIPVLQESLQNKQKHIIELQKTEQSKRSNLQSNEGRRQRKCADILSKLERYRSALGLSFQKQGNRINFTFTKIVPAHKEREFKVALTLADGDRYKVVACQPCLLEIHSLETQLIQSNDLKRFIIFVRKAFVQHAMG